MGRDDHRRRDGGLMYTTTDPRIAGRIAPVGATVQFVEEFVATPLYKYAAADTSWCTLPRDGAAEPVTSDPRVGAGLDRPVGATVMYVAAGLGLTLTKYGGGPKDWCSRRTAIPASDGSASAYLRADGTWASPPTPPTFSTGAAGLVPASAGADASFLRGDGSWATPDGGVGGSASATAATLTLGAAPRREHRVTVTDAAVSPTSKLLVTWGTALDTDANGPDMDAVIFAGRPSAGSFTVVVTSAQPISGDLKINYLVG
jgi:hypothetical protein